MLPTFGLDIALTTGWAFAGSRYRPALSPLEAAAAGGTSKPVSGFVDFRRHRLHDEDHGGVYVELRRFILDRIAVFQPRIFVFEAPLMHHMGAAAARMLLGMAAVAEEAARSKGLHVVEFHVADVKIHATGKGNAKKPDMIEAARLRGWKLTEHNETDACWLVDLAAAKQAREMARRAAT